MIRDTNRAAENVVAKLSRELRRAVTAGDLWKLIRAIDTARVIVTDRNEALALRAALVARAQRLEDRAAPSAPPTACDAHPRERSPVAMQKGEPRR